MKTFILKLERHDDIVSVRDKMGWAKHSRILIVWPEGDGVLNRRLDLMLLLRRSQELGSQLAIVSQDSEVRFFGPRLGIPVYRAMRKAQDQHWRVPFRFRKNQPPDLEFLREQSGKASGVIPERPTKASRPMNPAVRLVFFSGGVFALLAIAASLAPSAQLILTPKMLVQDVFIDAYTNSELQESSLAGAVLSEKVNVVVEGRDTQKTSGSIRLPYQASEGKAIFKNLTDQKVTIPKETVVRPTGSQPMRYATTIEAIIPAGPGVSVEVAVRCLSPGVGGNLPAGALTTIEGTLGTQISVVNPDPITGGSDRTEPAPSPQDRSKLAEKLQASLEETARQEIRDRLSPGDLFIPASLSLSKTLDESYQPEDQQPSDQVTLIRQLEFQAQVVRYKQMVEMVRSVFDANLPPGYSAISDSLQLEIIDEPASSQEGTFAWKIHGTRRIQAEISDSEAIRLTLGRTPEQAIVQLQRTLPLEAIPEIRLMPDWWPRMPVLPFRIVIQRQFPEKQASSGESDL